MTLADTYPNALTSTVPGAVKIPMILPTDREAFQAAILTCNAVGRPPRIVRIRDTLHLGILWISEALIEDVEDDAAVTVTGPAGPVVFDPEGNLPDLS
jgi:hypothetical protein